MKTRAIETIIFDLDDTLVSTSKLQQYREHGDREGLRENISSSKLFAPVHRILEEIKARGIQLALVTNSPRWYTEALLAYHDIDVFDTVICYDEVGFDGIKPSPKGINLALSNLKQSCHAPVIYVGDQESDFIAAYSAGIKPIAPSWATRHPIDQVPAAIINSDTLIASLENYSEISLIADRTAFNRAFDFPKTQLNFIPLNEKGQVVPLDKKDVKLIAFGRYFSQGSPLTASLHEAHQLSKDIFAKELSSTYLIPQYYVSLFSRVVETLPQYAFGYDGAHFDIITVIPAKKNKNGRLENMLKRVASITSTKSTFIPDLFEFATGAVSLKTLGAKEVRLAELKKNLHLKSKYVEDVKGKSILIVDDVITTGATFLRAFELLESAGATLTFGACLAKTVSVREDMKFCPECNRIMKVRTNHTSGIHFYGCTGFFEDENRCKYNEEIKIKDCPRCGEMVVKRYNRYKQTCFLSCISYGTAAECGYTDNVEEI